MSFIRTRYSVDHNFVVLFVYGRLGPGAAASGLAARSFFFFFSNFTFADDVASAAGGRVFGLVVGVVGVAVAFAQQIVRSLVVAAQLHYLHDAGQLGALVLQILVSIVVAVGDVTRPDRLPSARLSVLLRTRQIEVLREAAMERIFGKDGVEGEKLKKRVNKIKKDEIKQAAMWVDLIDVRAEILHGLMWSCPMTGGYWMASLLSAIRPNWEKQKKNIESCVKISTVGVIHDLLTYLHYTHCNQTCHSVALVNLFAL